MEKPKPDQKTHGEPISIATELTNEERVAALKLLEMLKPFTHEQRRLLLTEALNRIKG